MLYTSGLRVSTALLELLGHDGRVTDLTFNPSGKWLVSSSMDCTVCVWDLLTGCLIDRSDVEQVPVTTCHYWSAR